MELADTSAWAQRKHPLIRGWFDAALLAGQLAICDMVVLEILQGEAAWDRFERSDQLLDLLPWVPMDAAVWKRALQVQRMLASGRRGQRRMVKLADLLVASTAESATVPVVHYDEDYELIARARNSGY